MKALSKVQSAVDFRSVNRPSIVGLDLVFMKVCPVKKSVFSEMMIASQLVEHSFQLRSDKFSPSQASEVIGWLIEQFALDRCAFLASAAARIVGRDHYVSIVHADGRMAHAVLAVSPQYDDLLRGDGVDVFGRRPLKEIVRDFQGLSGANTIVVGDLIPSEDFAPGEEDVIQKLLLELPWFRKVLRRSEKPSDGHRLQEICSRLTNIWINSSSAKLRIEIESSFLAILSKIVRQKTVSRS